jgi:hypothetical protein
MYEPVAHGEGNGFQSRMAAQLDEHVLYVRARRRDCDVQSAGDALGIAPLDEQLEDLALTCAEKRGLQCYGIGCPGALVDRSIEDLEGQDGLATPSPVNGVQEHGRLAVLGDDRTSTRLDSRGGSVIVFGTREDQDFGRRGSLTHAPSSIDAAVVREQEVHDANVDVYLTDRLDRGSGTRRSRHHVMAPAAEQCGEGFGEKLVIVADDEVHATPLLVG